MDMEVEKIILNINEKDVLIIDGVIVNQQIWATFNSMLNFFNITSIELNKYLDEIFSSDIITEESQTKRMSYYNFDGKKYLTKFYNLNILVLLAFHINTSNSILFRKYVIYLIKEYIIKGFLVCDDKVRNPKRFDKKYFENQLELINDIRTSKRRIDQRITDLYTICYDYNSKSEITKNFYLTVQGRLIRSVTNRTAKEIILKRGDKKDYLRLFLNNDYNELLLNNKVLSKNYLTCEELSKLNMILKGLTDKIEKMNENYKLISMHEFIEIFNEYVE